ncbi:hypothetical protein VOLCADRAFT_63727 [Volvox carteri f. nagariensis]|uniref:CBS domain-containing protein n=1 Tax=Volvox carteri f. nagariensis TaxID=3068 RepID=D8U448_VOLCA|nr:uncharacterized protein VOLCADRAFT_63727 [Volvox carteri f. nagariensis]EFJ45435.1 hypothetical protein VOLCADRAFT_63727 [Volvox carteri f. nagariensis]|eukprot:XP_002953462.1 hypothetical protein VOLCADRAFT_63727 [Volvox carteri f. nagariensis]
MSYFVPTRFVWRFGGRQVHLCGSFTRWVETVPMAPVDGTPGVFAVVVHLPPGYHQYKFIVDGKWRHDETAPFMPDPLGNVNNWLFVRRIDPTPTPVATSSSGSSRTGGPNPAATSHHSNGRIARSCGEYTRKKISDFLHAHTAYELIPESGKVVVLDLDLPVRQAFHALHEQGTASAPLWDAVDRCIPGVISASDFISILRRLRHSVSSGANPMSEAEMDAHTIRGLREEAAAEGREPKRLVYVLPDEDLAKVVARLAANKCSMAPVLSGDPGGAEPPHVLHLATLSGVLACLMRHFRASLASLPLLSQPLGSLPLGTWSPDAAPLHTVTASTSLTTALALLLEAGVSALPVVDEKRCLVDVYARSQITDLCKGGAYNRLQWEDVTVAASNSAATGGSLSSQLGARVWVVTKDDTLRTVVERLAVPGVRRLVVVHPETRRVEGIISLSDVAQYLFL